MSVGCTPAFMSIEICQKMSEYFRKQMSWHALPEPISKHVNSNKSRGLPEDMSKEMPKQTYVRINRMSEDMSTDMPKDTSRQITLCRIECQTESLMNV
jgi:hypothetical protein